MAGEIVLTGLAANSRVPGIYTETAFAQGESAGILTSYPILLMGNKTSAGAATTNTVIYGPDTATQVQDEAQVIAQFGTGSELHRMWLACTSVNKTTAIYFIAVTASGGTAASLTLTVANTATANGVVRVYCGGWFSSEAESYIDVPVTSGDLTTAIATNIASYINQKTRWPVTASPSGSTVVITARIAGPRGNFIKVETKVITSGTIATTVSGATTLTALSSGATADDNTTALATIAPRRFYWIAPSAEDSSQGGAVATQVDTVSAPTTGIRQRCILGSVDTISNVNSIATGRNNPRCDVVWQPSSEYTPAELAAYAAGLYALLVTESLPKPLHNFCYFDQDANLSKYWKIRAPRSGTSPSAADIVSALNNGVTPIKTLNGKASLVRRITTKCLNGSNPDFRCSDSHKVDVPDFLSDLMAQRSAERFTGKDIADDPAPGQRVPGPSVVTPRVYRAMVAKCIDQFDDDDQLQNAAAIKANMLVQRSVAAPTRMTAYVPTQVIDIMAQAAHKVAQVA
jgi:phage tail sheath gpL-like